MPSADDVVDAVATDAVTGIASASNAAGSVTQHSLGERIMAAEFVANKTAAARGKKPFRILRMPRQST